MARTVKGETIASLNSLLQDVKKICTYDAYFQMESEEVRAQVDEMLVQLAKITDDYMASRLKQYNQLRRKYVR